MVVHEIERAKEDVAILLNSVWHSVVIDFECVTSRILLLNSNFQGLKQVLWWGIVKKGDDMDGVDDIVGYGYRLAH